MVRILHMFISIITNVYIYICILCVCVWDCDVCGRYVCMHARTHYRLWISLAPPFTVIHGGYSTTYKNGTWRLWVHMGAFAFVHGHCNTQKANGFWLDTRRKHPHEAPFPKAEFLDLRFCIGKVLEAAVGLQLLDYSRHFNLAQNLDAAA